MKTESVNFGKKIKKIREAKKMSQGVIGKALGVSRGYISNIEHGKANPTLSTITKLAKALGVSSDKLFK